MDVQHLERKLLELEAKFNRVFPTQQSIDDFVKNANNFYDFIGKRKPKTIVSPKIMSRILELHPNMKANQIDDFLLEHGIGSEKALIDFLDLEQKNRDNKPLIEDETQ